MKQTIIEIYEEILCGKRSRFPRGTWSNDPHCKIINVLTRHLVSNILKFKEKELKEKWNSKLIKEWKLSGACNAYFQDSPYRMLDAAFPNQFKPWELKYTPKNYWTKDQALEILYYWIEEKEELSRKELLDVFDYKWLKKRHLDSPFQMFWNSSTYQMLNEAYPNQFKPWELRRGARDCWKGKEESLKILRVIVEELDLSFEELKDKCSVGWLAQQGLRTPLNRFFNDSPYKMLDAAFPNQFKPWELKVAPNKTWTNKKKAIEIIQKEIEQSGLHTNEICKNGVSKLIKEKKLITPFNKFWKNSPNKMLSEIYHS